MESLGFFLCTSLITVGIITKYYLSQRTYIAVILIVLGVSGNLWLFIRKIFQYCLFPGTLWLFRRSMEVIYSREISLQIFKKLEKLKSFLSDLKASNFKEIRLVNSRINKLVITLIENLEGMSKLTYKQKRLLNSLIKVKNLLQKIQVKSQGIDLSLWVFIDIQESRIDEMFELVLTKENEELLSTAISAIQDVQDLIKISFQDRNCFGKCLNILFDINLGTLDYMRSDLIKRFNCEQYLIENKIDSIYISTESSSSLAVIICNPNAGFYEFTYFQSEWIEFYLSHKVNVILWNYRGYGLSAGRPHLLDNINDGFNVMKFYLQEKGLKKICVHGESIGGSVAIKIASHPNCCFLFADRTFGRLSEVIKYGYGRLAYLVFKFTLLPDIDHSDAYISLDCYKLICSDPKDAVIPDIASLKTSVALNFFLNKSISIGEYYSKGEWKKNRFIVPPKEYEEFCKALLTETFGNSNGLETGKNSKVKEQMKTEGDGEADKGNSKKYLNILNGLDSCGVSLRSIIMKKSAQFYLRIWLMTLEIWGSYGKILVYNEFAAVDKVVNDLNDVVNDISTLKNRSESVEVIFDFTVKVLRYLEGIRERYLNSFRNENLESYYCKAGSFMVVNCGHGGHFTSVNRHNLELHFIRSSFL